MTTFSEKLSILRKSKEVFKNWLVYPLLYYNLTQKDFVIFKTRTNKIIKIRKNSTDLMALTHVWLIEEYKRPNFEIKSNDVVIDVGAHIGLFTLYASQYCTQGLVYSYEPVKENYELLVENTKLNDLKHVRTFNTAVSNSNQPITLFINNDESGHSMFSQSSQSVSVDSISLKKIFDVNKIEQCNFLKLDCEGAEYEILRNLPSIYFEKIDKMVIEYHMADSQPELLVELKRILTNQNFEIEIKSLFSDIGFLYAKKVKVS
ncbi:MAG: FkbM family methyltransferase [Candidatus Nitrosopumilus sp. bin_68KS]